MVTLLLLGALLPIHVSRAWRGKRNRASGAIIITLNAVLVTASFGLYYTASEAQRPWISNVHLSVGLSLPVFLIMHIALGRRTPSQSASGCPRWTIFSQLYCRRWRSHPS
jgi:ABC-type antimicrobial peptide transport system permease subunit